jgi:hypothetical protein
MVEGVKVRKRDVPGLKRRREASHSKGGDVAALVETLMGKLVVDLLSMPISELWSIGASRK